MRVTIPDWGLILMIGASGAGKTTFVRKHFRATEVLSSDHYRSVVADDDRSRQTSTDAFEVMREIARRRLGRKLHAVIDATNLVPEDRRRFIDLARDCHAPLAAIIADPGERACLEQNGQRADPRPRHVIQRHCRAVRRSVKSLRRESVRRWYRFASPRSCERPPSSGSRSLATAAPFPGRSTSSATCTAATTDCLRSCTEKLGYSVSTGGRRFQRIPRRASDSQSGPSRGKAAALPVGDLVDRGPRSSAHDAAFGDGLRGSTVRRPGCVPGNHDVKLLRWPCEANDVQSSPWIGRNGGPNGAPSPTRFGKRLESFRRRAW